MVAPSAIPFGPDADTPREMNQADIAKVIDDFVSGAERAEKAGFDMIELHCGHGYLLSSFISKLSNQRTDAYGGDVAGRMKLPLEVFHAVRKVWPDHKPISARISAVDWVEGGNEIEDALEVARLFRKPGSIFSTCRPATSPMSAGPPCRAFSRRRSANGSGRKSAFPR